MCGGGTQRGLSLFDGLVRTRGAGDRPAGRGRFISMGAISVGVAVAPDGRHVYVANFGSNFVSVIDTSTNAVVNTIPVAGHASGVAVAPDGSRIYVAVGSPVVDVAHHALAVIDAATNAVVTTIPIGGSPTNVAIAPDGRYVYVTHIAPPLL